MNLAGLSTSTPFPFVVDLFRESGDTRGPFALSSTEAPRGKRPAAQDHDSVPCGRRNLAGRAPGASPGTGTVATWKSRGVAPIDVVASGSRRRVPIESLGVAETDSPYLPHLSRRSSHGRRQDAKNNELKPGSQNRREVSA